MTHVGSEANLGAGGEISPELVRSALVGDAAASKRLVDSVTSVVRVRVARYLMSLGAARTTSMRLEYSDAVQGVLLRFYESDARLLRQWDPARGLSWRNWIGLITQRILRSTRPLGIRAEICTQDVEGDADRAYHPLAQLEARSELQHLSAQLETLSQGSQRVMELDANDATVRW